MNFFKKFLNWNSKKSAGNKKFALRTRMLHIHAMDTAITAPVCVQGFETRKEILSWNF